MAQPSGWCTDWGHYELSRLWQMVSGEDDEQGWAQVQSWFRLRGAIEAQRQRLFACRQTLEEQWPPERSPAAAAFIGYLDRLIESMTETAASAESTARGLGGIMNALATAKAEIKSLYDEWQAASTDLTPHWWDHTEDELTARARSVMAATELEVAGYTPMIEIPRKYEFLAKFEPLTPVGPPASTDRNGRDSYSNTSPAAAGSVPFVSHDPPPPQPGTDSSMPSSGPLLTGVTEPMTLPPAGLPTGPSINSDTASPNSHNAQALPSATSIPSRQSAGMGRLPAPDGSRIGSTRSPIIPTTGPQTGRPAASLRPPLPSTPVMTSTAGFNGTTGPPRTAIGPSTYRTTDGHLANLAPPPGRPKNYPGSDPRNPWIVQEGVNSVITPPEIQPYDPGPGIIGIDR